MSSSKIAVVTGANKGIGFAISKALCEKFDGILYMTARDEARGTAAVNELKKLGFNPRFHQLDIDDINSIRNFKSYLKKEHGGLDVLVNNAAIAYKHDSTVPVGEQAENTIRVNFFANFQTCEELFPLLKPHARVVNVCSSVGKLSNVTSKELQDKFRAPDLTIQELSNLMNQFVQDAKAGVHLQKGWANSTYAMSKVGFIALSFIQQREFDKDSRPDIVVNAVHPGYVDTDMTSHKGHLTPEQGAIAPVYLALLPSDVKSPRGEFIWNDKTVATW